MDNNSFLSGLSSIGEAIGESSYGRCISLLVVDCEPAQGALAVRLGGPGCPWVTLALPMQRPVVLHRQGSVRVPRRATELAFATSDYALSPAADADGVQPSRAMVAMDVLTASGMSPAGTALSVSTTANATGDNPVLELAATGAAAVDGEGEDGPAAEAPLHVHFRWAVGEVLPGAPDHTPSPSLFEEEAEAEAVSHTHEPHEQGDEDDDRHDGTDIPTAETAEANADADTAEAQGAASLGDDSSTPATSGMSSPWSAPPLHRLSSDQPDGAPVTAMATASALGSPTHGAPSPRRTSETVVGDTAASPRQLDPTNDDDGGTPAREGGSAPPATPPLEDDANGSEAAAPLHLSDGSRAIVPDAGSSTPPATGEGEEEEGEFADELFSSQRNPSVQSRASGTYTPSSRSNTPRRQRPSNYRRSTIHMEMAPAVVAPSKAAASNADEEEPTDDTVHISDDDDDATGALMMHQPPPPPPPPPNPVPPQAAATASLETQRPPSRPLPSLDPELVEPAPAAANAATSGTAVNQQRTSRRGSAHQTASPTSASAVPTHTPQPPASMHHDHHAEMAEAKPAPARPRPTVDNLFEGADDAALIVTVGVVAVYNAKGAADPHRVVAVALEAASSATTLAFRTTPALRGLATAVPQLSAPVLLLSGAAAKDHDDNDGSAPPVLQATCVVTEQVGGGGGNRDSDGADSGAASAASTTLWSSTADLAPSCASSPSSAAQINHEVRFTGANGDVVLTLWTYMTVSAYRDAVLNLRSREAPREAPQQQQQPVLQMLLVDESARAQRQGTTSRRHTPTASVWVSSPCTSEASRADAVTHRVVAVAAPAGIVHQPVSVPLRDPFVFVAVQPANAPAYVQPIFTRMFSHAWTRSTAAAHKGSSKSARVVLYYRIVGSATAAAAAAADPSSMPPPLRDTSSSSSPHRASESAELRELTISIEPPAYPLHALPSDKLHHDADAGAAPFAGWSLVLRHAVTHTVLAHSASAASGLTYHGFLPLASDAHSATRKRATATAAAPEANGGAGEEMARLPWEVLLVSEEAGRGASTSARPRTGAMRAITRGPAAGKAGAAAWSGSLWVSCAALYSAPSSGAHWAMSVCVSSAPATASTSALRTPSVAMGAALRVRCAVRAHALGGDSAVFCLRSLHLVASPVAGAAPPQSSSPAQATPSLPPSRVQLWFTTGGSTPDEVRAAWAAEADAEVPSVKQLQRAWAPAVAAAHCSATPPLAVNAEGRLQPAGAPVLLSTCNTRARLCIALTSTAEAASGTTDGLPDARALQRGVTAVRKSAVRRYRRGQVTEDSNSSDKSSDDRRGERAPLTEAQMGDVFVECVTAVAMRVDNYAEVDLSPSLVAASERPGQTRHRLLLSSVSGTVRMSRHILLELQGQWIKMPRRVAVVSDEYTPSPRLWGLRCSCVVRRPDPSPRVPYSAAAADAADGAELAQEVLEAHLGYDIVVQSVPLDYGDPSEHTVQALLPGLSYDKLVVQMKARDARLRPYQESIRSAPSGPPNPSLRRGGRSTVDDDGATAFEDTAELLEHVFGPTGLAHATYMSESSHKVAVVHFVFGDAYTTRTILSVACAPSAAAAVNAMTSTPSKPYSNGHSPVPRPPSSPLPLSASVSGAAGVAACAVQVSCDSLTRTSTVYSFLSESAVMREFPGVSHRRYAPELTWYHGGLSIAPSEELRRREAGEAAWRRGLTEQRLGPPQAPGPLVVSAVTHHPFDCLPLVVEPSLTRCGEGRYCVAFGGLSTVTGTPSASVYVFDAVAQMWRSLRSRRSLRGTLSASVSASLPPARYGHTAVFRPANGAVYVFGGRGVRDGAMSDAYSAVTPATVFADVWSLACDAVAGCVTATELRCAWAESSAAAPGSASESRMSSSMLDGDFGAALARWRHAAVLHDDYLVVLGGQSSSGACCSCAELLYLDIKTQEWAPRRSFGVEVPCPRYGLAAATLSGSAAVYVFGGWGAEKGAAAAAATDKAPQNGSGANGKAAGKDGVVALSDFFKMDLITRMWSRVEANGAVRPPALDLPDMTSSLIDGCPVLLLVGGRVAGPVTAASEPPSTADLDVFLFSTATLFWRRVAMDCMPVPTRFGLRAVASAATGTARPMAAGPTRGPVRPDTSRLRRTLPSRGQRIGDVLVVGGLPHSEADVANTAPAISLLLAAGHGSITGAGRRVASASPAAGESQPEMLTPRPPAASRSPRARRPASGPARVSARKAATPLRSPRPPAVVATSGWLHSIHQPRNTDGWADADVVGRQPAPPTAPAVAIRKAVDRLHVTAPTPPPRLPQHHTSCYSTLTRAEQRRLVHRLYTQDLEIRAARRQQLEAEMYDQQRKPLAHQISKSRSRSPGGRQARLASAPVHRPHYDAASLTSPSAPRGAADGAAAAGFFPGSTAADAPVAHRDLQGAFLGRGSSTSPTTSSSRFSSGSPSADEESDEEAEASSSASTVESEVDAVAEPLVPGVEEAADRSAASVSDSPDNTDDASSSAKASAASAPEREAAAPPPIPSADSFEKESEDSDTDGANDTAPPPPPAAPVAAPAAVPDESASEPDDDDFESDSSADSYVVARPEQQERSASSLAAPAPAPAPVPVPASEQSTATSRSASAAEAVPASAAASSSSSRPATPPTPEQEEVHDAAATAPSTPPETAISPASSSVHSAAAAVPLPPSPPRGSDAEQEDEEHDEEPATDEPVPASVADEPPHEEEEQQQSSPAAAAAEDASGAPPDSYDDMDDDWEAESEPEEEKEEAAAEVRDASVAEMPSEREEDDDAIHEVAEEAAKSASSVPSSQSSAAPAPLEEETPVPEEEDDDDDDWEAESSEATKSDAAAPAADEVPPSPPSSPMSSAPASEVAAEEAEPPQEQQPPSSAPTSSAASRSSSAHEHEEEAPSAATPAISNSDVSEVSAAPPAPPVEESHGDHDDDWEAVSDEAGAKSSSNVDAAVPPPALDDDADTGAEESSVGSAVAPSEDDGVAAVPPPAPREHPTPPSSPSSSSAAVPTPPADTDQDEASSQPSHVDEDVEQPFAEGREAPFSAAVEARAGSGSSPSSAEMSAQPSIPLTLQSSGAAHRQSLAVTPFEVLCEDEEWNGDEDQKLVLPPSVKSEIEEETPADDGAAAEVPPAEAPEVEEAAAARASEEGETTAEASAATEGAGAVPAAPEAEEIGGDDSDAASVATSAPAKPASPPDESVDADEERPDVPEEEAEAEAEEVDASHEQAATPPHGEAEEVNTDEDSLSSPASSLDESALVMVHDAANTSAAEPPEELEGDAAAGEEAEGEAEAEAAAEAAASEHHPATPSTPSESDLGDDAPAQPQPDDAPVDDEESDEAQTFEEPEASPPSHISEAEDEADGVASEPELPDHNDDDEADGVASEPELPDHNDGDEADGVASEPELPDHNDGDEADGVASEPELPGHNDGDDDEAAPATPPSVPSSASAPVPPQLEEEAVDEEGDVESGNEGLEDAASAPADESHEASTEHPIAAHEEEEEPADEAADLAPSDLPPPRMPAPRRSAQSSHVSSVSDDGEEENAAGEAPASVQDTDSEAAPAAEAAVDDAHGAQSSSADEVSAAGSRPADEEEEEAPRAPEPAEGEEAAASEASALSSPDPAVQPSTLTGYAEEAEVPPPPPALAAAAEESPYEEAGGHGEAAEAQAQASAEDAAASPHSSLLSSISATDDLEPTEESAAAAADDGSDDADEEGAEAAAEAPAEVAEATSDPTDGEPEAAAAEEGRSTGVAAAGAAVEGESLHSGAVEEAPEAPVVDDAGSSEEPATDADAPQSATDRSGALEEGEGEGLSVEPPAEPAADTTAVSSAVENADDAADAAALLEHPSRAEEEVEDEEVGHADDFDTPHEGSGTDAADASEEEAAAPTPVEESAVAESSAAMEAEAEAMEDVPSGAATEEEATEADAPLDNADASEASEPSEAAPVEETPEAGADPGEEEEAADVNREQPASPWEEQLIEAPAGKPLVLSASEHNGSGSGAPANPFAPALTAESSFPAPAPAAGQEAKGKEETASAEELSADAAPAPAAPATPPSVGSDGEASQHGEVAQEQEQGLEEAEEPADATELDDGRDLLDRRRGFEEEVQDDDFNF